MSASVIEGTIVEAPLKVRRKAFVRYDHILFERAGGGTERLGKVIAVPAIADHIAPGARGRFYLYKTIDVRGVAGVRLADGTECYAYPGNNLVVFGIIVVVNLAWIALRVFGTGDLPLLGVILVVGGVVGFFMTWTSRAESRRLFDAGTGAPAVSRPAAGAVPSPGE